VPEQSPGAKGSHVIVRDRAGWSGHFRITCTTCRATLVRQPFYTQAEWDREYVAWLSEHPSAVEALDA
jgi:hypothetical protein